MALLYNVIQDNIFNLNSLGKRAEEKTIIIPTNLILPNMVNDFEIASVSPAQNKQQSIFGNVSSPDKIKEYYLL
jgi:hypothetical protein